MGNMKAFIAIIACLVAYASAEAEAEADPAVLYANAYHPYGHYGYGYGLGAYGYGLGYAGYYGGYYGYPYGTYAAGVKSAPCVNAANVPVPCARKRRDADAEDEADPAYLYGGYYGYPGYARYGYGGYYGLGGYYGGYYRGLYGKSAPCVNAANVPVPCA